jgi:hypothetical protein
MPSMMMKEVSLTSSIDYMNLNIAQLKKQQNYIAIHLKFQTNYWANRI